MQSADSIIINPMQQNDSLLIASTDADTINNLIETIQFVKVIFFCCIEFDWFYVFLIVDFYLLNTGPETRFSKSDLKFDCPTSHLHP